MGTKTPSVRFVTADGKVMEFRWDGTRTLDGKPHSFAGYGLYHGPFVNGEIGTGIITLTARGGPGARLRQGGGVGAMMDSRPGDRITGAVLLLCLLLPFVFGAGPETRPEGPRMYAAVFLVRGSVAGSNRGTYGGSSATATTRPGRS